MAARFRRSVSLPRQRKVFPANSPPIRSSSFPNRSAGISKLEEDLRAAEAWNSSGDPHSSSRLTAGLLLLQSLHQSLTEFLRLPQNQEKLRGSSSLAENLLEDLLLLADAHGSFRLAVISLQEIQSAAEIAIKRNDRNILSGSSKLLKKAEKEIIALAVIIEKADSDNSESELAVILKEFKAATFSVSAAVFRGTAAAVSLAAAFLKCKYSSLKRRNLPPIAASPKEDALLTAVIDLGECLREVEIPCEKIFSSLVNARVSVLNMMGS